MKGLFRKDRLMAQGIAGGNDSRLHISASGVDYRTGVNIEMPQTAPRETDARSTPQPLAARLRYLVASNSV
jgi:hypothetical protein